MMQTKNKEEQILCKHLTELANQSCYRGISIFSDFLNLNEQNLFYGVEHELPEVKYYFYGGYPDSERKILCFCGDNKTTDQAEIPFPITCVKIVPRNIKFSDCFTHRDFLGAVLNLGMDRSKIGDILVAENQAYLFCNTVISPFICQELYKVKHTMVETSVVSKSSFHYEPKRKELVGTVSSVRLDSVLSVAFHSSRSSFTGLIEGGKVFVNSKVILSNSYLLEENDIVSVRGLGKFLYAGTGHQTKKGRYCVKVQLYV
jgi:RNA-binding protein YlmH